jgi:hypothetical protein
MKQWRAGCCDRQCSDNTSAEPPGFIDDAINNLFFSLHPECIQQRSPPSESGIVFRSSRLFLSFLSLPNNPFPVRRIGQAAIDHCNAIDKLQTMFTPKVGPIRTMVRYILPYPRLFIGKISRFPTIIPQITATLMNPQPLAKPISK